MAGKLAARLASMSEAERARFLAGLPGAAGPGPVPGPVPRQRADGRATASFLQEQLWFLHHLAGQEPAYNVPFYFRLHGPLQQAALCSAAAGVLARHDALRTRFVLDDRRLLQVISPAAPPPPVLHMPGITSGDRQAAAMRRVATLARTRFDLATGPLCRAELLRIGPGEHVLAWVSHHAVADGWSVGIVFDEICSGYRRRISGQPPLPVPALQFADVAEWQRASLTPGRLAALIDHWRGQLGDACGNAVPADFPRPAQQAFTGASAPLEFEPGLARAVALLARRGATSVSSVLLAAFAAVLGARGGGSDVIVGVPFAGRSRAELETVIGPLSNALPLRIRLSADPAFADLVGQVSAALSDGEAHQEVPFAALAGALAPRRDPSRNPVFQVVFNLGAVPQGSEPVAITDELAAEPCGQPNGTARMDLELMMESGGGRLHGRLEYNTALFTRQTVTAMVRELADLLAAASDDPRRRLSQLPVLAALARRRSPGAPAAAPAMPSPAHQRIRQITDWLDT